MSSASPPNLPRTKSTEIPWRERPHVTMQTAAQIAGLSVASIYRFASENKLSLKRLGGRTLVDTTSLVALTDSVEVWTPAAHVAKACAARASAKLR